MGAFASCAEAEYVQMVCPCSLWPVLKAMATTTKTMKIVESDGRHVGLSASRRPSAGIAPETPAHLPFIPASTPVLAPGVQSVTFLKQSQY